MLQKLIDKILSSFSKKQEVKVEPILDKKVEQNNVTVNDQITDSLTQEKPKRTKQNGSKTTKRKSK